MEVKEVYSKDCQSKIDAAQVKADGLSASQKIKVYPLICCVKYEMQDEKDGDGNLIGDKIKSISEIAIGFISEPTRQAKMVALDVMQQQQSLTLSGEQILKASLIKAESDPRIFSTASESDAIYIGACQACTKFVEAYSADIKKK